MNARSRAGCVLVLLAAVALPAPGSAEPDGALPSPLALADVVSYARRNRQEIVAARARARAAGERPAIVSALDDPMIMPSIDHLPFELHGVDASLMVEQSFPLSRVRRHRERGAQAEARRLRAEADRVALDVELDAAGAFLMLRERQQTRTILAEQVALARQLLAAASARYGSGTGSQPEVLRAEIEVARLAGETRVLEAEIDAAEAMLNMSLGRAVDAPLPPLAADPERTALPSPSEVRQRTLRGRPELAAGRAEIQRGEAEIAEMKSMSWPMGVVRTGPAYTMADRWGWMLTIGLSIPLQRGRLRAGVREAEAMTDMARADLRAMTRMAEGEAGVARGQLVAAEARVKTLRDDVLPRARQAIEPSVAAYAAGRTSLVSVLDTAQALWAVQGELVAAESALGLAWARLERAQGRSDTGASR